MGHPVDFPIFSTKDPSGWFNAAAERAGIEGITRHTLRHTFASRHVMLGVNLKIGLVPMGLKSLRMTARYACLAAHHKRAAVELIVPVWANEVHTGQ